MISVRGVAYWARQLAIVLLVSALSLVGLVLSYLHVPVESEPPDVFIVAPGTDASMVATRLDSLGLLPSRGVWLSYARLVGAERHLKAGPYLLDGLSPAGIMRALRHGAIVENRVTIPEGSTVWEVATIVHREIGIPGETFLELTASPELLATVDSPGPSLEGYLFPDTYRLYRGIPPDRVVRAMTQRFLLTWRSLTDSTSTPQGFSRHELVTMGSLVEAEAAVDEERPRIAAVYYNRLRIGMRLMADPTVVYALGRRPRRLLYEHLRIDSPYNTYLYPGLPPGPICNPGAASLAAALNPLEGCRDLYFVAAGDGSHIFSRTHRDHIYAKSESRRRQREQRQIQSSAATAPTGSADDPSARSQKTHPAGADTSLDLSQQDRTSARPSGG